VAHDGGRALEGAPGISTGALGVFLLVSLLAVPSLLATSFDWRLWLGTFVTGLVGSWCTQTSWRLFTGRERQAGGLLSPFVLTLTGVGFPAGAIAWVVFEGVKVRGLITLIGCAFGCFNSAWSRYHRGLTRHPLGVAEFSLRPRGPGLT
jgi:hypothetical protein